MTKDIIAKLPPAEALLNMEKVRRIAEERATSHIIDALSKDKRKDIASPTVQAAVFKDAFRLAELYELSIYRRLALEKMMEDR